jgi:chromosomal replication initiation ATPase DnaA
MKKTEIEDVVQAVSQYSGVSTADILSPTCRGYSPHWLRNTVMYLAERLTSYSPEEIGRYFGHNASGVRFAISAIEREFYGNPRCRAEIEQLQRTIRGPEWDSAREWLRSVCELDSKIL